MWINEEANYVALGMKTYGGSFVKGLGEALSHADQVNQIKIKTTWWKLWHRYLEAGKELKEVGK